MQKAGPSEPVDVWVYSAYPKDNWLARKPGDFTHVEHPGTAIRISDDLFEILTMEEISAPGYVVRYGLKKWDAKHTARVFIPYTPMTQAQSAADYLGEKRTQGLRARILWLFPLAGLAPDPMQRDWETKTALNMAAVSAFSTLATLAFYITLGQIYGRFPPNRGLLVLINYLGIESFFRLLWIVSTGKPHGTILLTLPYLLWEAVARPDKRRQEKEQWVKFSYEGDEVIREPGATRLKIRSMLFDDLLIGPSPVRFEGALYRPVLWHQEGAGLGRRLIYDLERTDDTPEKKYREYTQPRSPERQKQVEELTRQRDRTHTLALLWGVYPRADQLRLEAKYHFPSTQWTAITAGLLLASSLLQTWATLLLHGGVHLFVGPAYFLFESLYRLYRSKIRLEPAGSLAGLIFGLFLHTPK
jgi:hypothetical protein